MDKAHVTSLLSAITQVRSTERVTFYLEDKTSITVETRHIDLREADVRLLCQARTNIRYEDIVDIESSS